MTPPSEPRRRAAAPLAKKAAAAAAAAAEAEAEAEAAGGRRGARTPAFWRPLLMLWIGLVFVINYQRNNLPAPRPAVDTQGRPQPSEAFAREVTYQLSHDYGMRVLGTQALDDSMDYLLARLYDLKHRASALDHDHGHDDPTQVPDFDITTQYADGSHLFEIMGQPVVKMFSNITNIAVRIGCGAACNAHTILMNGHVDSTIVSPGASDDAATIGVMLDMVRLYSLKPRSYYKNAIVFLFNGAEESLQDASYAFVTQHPFSASVRTVLNMDSMGSSGKALLFQATAPEVIRAYARVPYPHASVASSDVFKTGIIVSDTDFRQFEAYGHLRGIDTAFYRNSYLYHTLLDLEHNIERGSIQALAENSAVLLDVLATDVTLWRTEASRNEPFDYIYHDVLGLVFLYYSRTLLMLVTGGVLLMLIRLHRTAGRDGYLSPRSLPLAAAAAHVLAAALRLLAAAAAAGVVAVVFAVFVLEREARMIWFIREWVPFVLFVPLSFWVAQGVHSLLGSPEAVGPAARVYAERVQFLAMLDIVAVLTAALGLAGAGSAYLLTSILLAGVLAVAYDLRRLRQTTATPASASTPASAPASAGLPVQHITWGAYALVTLGMAPLLELFISFMDVLVPLTDRMGAEVPVDRIVAVVMAAFTFLHLGIVLPALNRVSNERRAFLSQLFRVAALACILCPLKFSRTFDAMHPKRIYVQHLHNHTSHEDFLLLGLSDLARNDDLVQRFDTEFDHAPRDLRTAGQNAFDWSTVHPFSHFLLSHRWNITHLVAPTQRALTPSPVLTVVLERETATNRTYAVTCIHPHHIWTVVTFEAHVLEWSLDAPLAQATVDAADAVADVNVRSRYAIRNAGGRNADRWHFTLTVHRPVVAQPFHLQVSGLERDTYARLVVPENKQAGFSWKWSDSWASAQVLAKAEQVAPDWTAGLYMSTAVQDYWF